MNESKMSGECAGLKNIMRKTTCVLLDIEGTTTSIDFVRKDLLNYGIQNIESYVVEHLNDPEVQKVVKELIILDNEDEPDIKVGETVMKLKTEMQRSQKSTAVKELEGLVWLNGFIKGELIGHVYPDVTDALKLWNDQQKKIYIYSNGSVKSQCVLFGKSIYGDLRNYIAGNFDTNIGSKLDPASYSKICQAVGKLPNEIVFISDHPQELSAAKQAGLQIVLIVRHPDCPMFAEEMSCLSPTDPIINSFLEVL